MRVTVYGDSILKGVLLDDGKYVVDHTWETLLSEKFHLTIRNCARFGCTIQKILPLIRRDSQRKSTENEFAVLELGGNDCDYNWSEISQDPEQNHECKTPPEVFLARYREAIRLIRESARIPVLMTLPPIHSERYLSFICRNGLSRSNILFWLGDVNAIDRWQNHYSEMVEQVAREEKTQLIDLRRAFPNDARSLESLLCVDGIHPSRTGQKLIFDTLCASLA